MQQILIGGDRSQDMRLRSWLAAWGLTTGRLPDDVHPAQVPLERARAVIYACGARQRVVPAPTAVAQAMAPLLLIGATAPPDLRAAAWLRIADPGPTGENLAAALKPCLAVAGGSADGTGFQDLVNHEMRTPLTAAGTALQTLAMQIERAGGPHLELVDIALRNIRRLERTVDWACDYLAAGAGESPHASAPCETALLDILEDLDDLASGQTLTWSTTAGDWDAVVCLDRESWRRLLRQTLRAIEYQVPHQPIHLELSLLAPAAAGSPSGLLMVVNLPCAPGSDQRQERRADDEVEQLRRLLAFTVNPALANRLELRFDIMRLSDRLRLRLMLPLVAAESYLVPTG